MLRSMLGEPRFCACRRVGSFLVRVLRPISMPRASLPPRHNFTSSSSYSFVFYFGFSLLLSVCLSKESKQQHLIWWLIKVLFAFATATTITTTTTTTILGNWPPLDRQLINAEQEEAQEYPGHVLFWLFCRC